jgi:hypothetical protein
MGRRSPRLSARQRKLWVWSLAMTAGTLVLAAGAWWIDRWRDTDRSDERAGVTAEFTQSALAAETPVRFSDVTVTAGLALNDPVPPRRRALPEDNGSGLAWGDYDGDGWPDLYVVHHQGANRLFHNNRDGTFRDVTAAAGVGDPDGFGMGATWVDYDNDGRLDLYVTNRGPNRLYRNNGDGTFTDVAAKAGVALGGWSMGAAWGDYDRDGHIDLYVCCYVTYDSDGREAPAPAGATAASDAAAFEVPFTLNPNSYSPQPNHLFRNRGDGTFVDVTAQAGVADPDGRSMAASFVDLDGDGWLDLYVNNDVSPDRLYHNGGADAPGEPVAFLDDSAMTGTADSRGSMGLSVAEVGDLDGHADGLPDLFITHWVTQENALYQSLVMPNGRLEYRDKSRPYGLAEISIDRVGWGSAFVDLDLDGRIDIATVNGSTLEQTEHPALLRPEAMFLFTSDGTRFHDVSALAGEATARKYNARGLAAADYDGDGRVDLAISTNEGRVILLHNDSRTTNRSLKVLLKGPAAAAFGAKVEVRAGGRHQVRWWGADVSYLSMHAAELVFGLGAAPTADEVVVHWTDGRTSTLPHVAAGVVVAEYASASPPPPSPR